MMKIAIGTVCIAAGAFVAYWAFRIWKFKQALDAFGRDMSREGFEQEVCGGYDHEPEDVSK